MNAEDVLTASRSGGVELVRFIYSDFTGVQRGKITSVDDLGNRLSHGINLTKAQMAFTLLDTIVDIKGMQPVGELRMLPAPETFTILPWAPTHASMCADLVEKNGSRYAACPRSWLKEIVARAGDRGYRIQAAFEPEFYLGHKNPETGRWEPADSSGIYAETGFDLHSKFLTDLTRTVRGMGMLPEMVYHEGGPGQQEISIHHSPALRAADNQMKLRSAVRGVALQHGHYASFAPKPFPWTFGSGAHVHLSIWDTASNRNLMYDPGAEETFSRLGRFFVGGILRHLPALIALTCPSYNSYRRLQPRSWSTSSICWGYDNRQAAVRAASPFWGREAETANIEIKAVDGSSNPYLALGGIIAAGLDGIEHEIDPGEPLPVDPSDLSDAEREQRGIRDVPSSLRAAVGEFAADPLYKQLMPELMWRAYQQVKLAECDGFEGQDEAFEIDRHFYAF
ncbi:MAG: glutamine synthetase family protein [Chloroflexota bacterium]|nr:glutamine synthetase family protein [Chloroflexota bacterium]